MFFAIFGAALISSTIAITFTDAQQQYHAPSPPVMPPVNQSPAPAPYSNLKLVSKPLRNIAVQQSQYKASTAPPAAVAPVAQNSVAQQQYHQPLPGPGTAMQYQHAPAPVYSPPAVQNVVKTQQYIATNAPATSAAPAPVYKSPAPVVVQSSEPDYKSADNVVQTSTNGYAEDADASTASSYSEASASYNNVTDDAVAYPGAQNLSDKPASTTSSASGVRPLALTIAGLVVIISMLFSVLSMHWFITTRSGSTPCLHLVASLLEANVRANTQILFLESHPHA